MGQGEKLRTGDFRLGWSAVLLISAAQFSAYADRALTAAFAPDLQAAFNLNDAQLGMLHGTAVILPYAAGMLFACIWLKTVRPFRLMAFSVIAWSLAAAGFAFATSYAELFAARVMLGLAEAAFAPAALSLLSVSNHPRPSVAISALTTGSSTGRSGGLLLGGALLVLASGFAATTGIEAWRLATLAIVLPNFLVAFALLRRSSMPVPLTPSSAHGLARTWRTMARSPGFFLSYFITAAAAIVIVQAEGAWAPTILHRRFGWGVADSAMAVGVIVLLCAPLGHLAAGRVVARRAGAQAWPHGLIAAGLVLTLLSALLLLKTSHVGLALIALGGFSAGGGFAAAAALIGLQSMVIAEQRFAANTIFLSTVTMTGYGLGPWLTGVVSDNLGDHDLRLALALITLGAATVAGLGALAGRFVKLALAR